jgi:tripartite-type tricarboxylate transporter receptor subunit TctC
MPRRRTLLAAAAFPFVARAQAWPTRQVVMLCPLAAGSTADILTRTMADWLARRTGQAFVVDNRPAAHGFIAMETLLRAPADGHTIALVSQGTHVFNTALHRTMPYDPLADFALVMPLAQVTNALIVPPDSPFRTPQDIVAAARARPGVLTYSSGGNGTSHHISAALFAQMTGAEFVHVPYRGAPQGITAVMAREVDFAFYNIPTVLTQIRGGLLRGLAVTSAQRSPFLPDLATMDALGVAGYEMTTWMGAGFRAGTPEPIVARLHALLNEALDDPAIREKLGAQGFEAMPRLTPAEFAAFLRAENAKWLPVFRAARIGVD